MKTRVHYPEELKWKVIEMKRDGYSSRTIMEKFGIKNVGSGAKNTVIVYTSNIHK